MVQIVLAEVVFREVRNVRKLDMRNVRRSEHSDIHFCLPVMCLALSMAFLGFPGESEVLKFDRKVSMGFWRDGNASGDVCDARWGLANVDG